MAKYEFPNDSFVKLNIKQNVGQWILRIITFNTVSRKKVKARFKRRRGEKLSMHLESLQTFGSRTGSIVKSNFKEKSCSDCKKLTITWQLVRIPWASFPRAIVARIRGSHPVYGGFEVTETTGHPALVPVGYED